MYVCVESMMEMFVCMRVWLYSCVCTIFCLCMHIACAHGHLHKLSCNSAYSGVSQRLACDAHGMPRVRLLCYTWWPAPHPPPCPHLAVAIGHRRTPMAHKMHIDHHMRAHRYVGFRKWQYECQYVRYTCMCDCVCARMCACVCNCVYAYVCGCAWL